MMKCQKNIQYFTVSIAIIRLALSLLIAFDTITDDDRQRWDGRDYSITFYLTQLFF